MAACGECRVADEPRIRIFGKGRGKGKGGKQPLKKARQCDGSHEAVPAPAVLDGRALWRDAPGEGCPVISAGHELCYAGLNCRFRDSHTKEVDGVLRNVTRRGDLVTWEMAHPTGTRLGHGESNMLPGFSVNSLDLVKDALVSKQATRLVAETDRRDEEDLKAKEYSRVGPPSYEKPRAASEKLRGKPVLAPLTTVGNLPFRRLCVAQHSELVTMSEMALARSVLDGGSELNMLRRHESEKCYGVQITGHYDTMTKATQYLAENCDCDFVDVNAACPLEPLHKSHGGGSIMMASPKKLETLSRAMRALLGPEKLLTVKLRTAHFEKPDGVSEVFGVPANGRIAHKLIPRLAAAGVDGLILHGRTAKQRYLRNADWDYVAAVKKELSRRLVEDHAFHASPAYAGTVGEVGPWAGEERPKPVLIGCGDIITWQGYYDHLRDVDSVMVGRGALVKPWIFKEIETRQHLDYSASQRFDMLRDFARFGLEHWGSDTKGVEDTRRYLLEFMSFFHRYIPLGLMEHGIPMQLGMRPPVFKGRDDLETMLASPNVAQWVSISEMLLGPVHANFEFLPKHKSSSYAQDAVTVTSGGGEAEG